jgi:hypothetical protein
MPYQARLIPRLSPSQRRGLVFLECSENDFVCASQVFYGLADKWRTRLQTLFDWWLGGNHHDKWFHGWNEVKYRECFTFKWKDAGTYHRLYGFLVHPKPNCDPRFHVCVLVTYDWKNDESTDFSILDKINLLRGRPEVIRAIQAIFPDEEGGFHATSNPALGAGTSLDRRKRR